MKTIKMMIIALSLFLAGQTYASSGAESLGELFDSMIQDWKDSPPLLRGDLVGGDIPDGDLGVPVSDGLYVLIALAGGYIMLRKRRKERLT